MFQEVIVDALLHENTRTSYTGLTFVTTEYDTETSINSLHTHVGAVQKLKEKISRSATCVNRATYKIPEAAHLIA